MRPALLLLTGLLSGCASLNAADWVRLGMIRVEQHPASETAYRVTWLQTTGGIEVHPSFNTSEGRQALLPLVLGESCRNGRIQEERRLPNPPDLVGRKQERLVTRVDCT